MIERKFSPDIPMIHMDRQRLMQAIFNGLLFLLKDSDSLAETLTLQTKGESQVLGKNWLQIDISWKSKLPTSNLTLVSADSWGFDDSSGNPSDPFLAQGVLLAAQIIQRHSGNFRLLTNRNSVLGFQIQLPLGIPNEQGHLIGSFTLSSASPQQVTSSSDPDSIFS